jgi:hypothetical protein
VSTRYVLQPELPISIVVLVLIENWIDLPLMISTAPNRDLRAGLSGVLKLMDLCISTGTAISDRTGVLAKMHRACCLFIVISLFIWSANAQSANSCDLNQDNRVNVTDVQLIVNMSLGTSSCTANIMGAGVCNVIVVQRVVNAALGGPCISSSATRTVSLNWTASSSSGVSGYNVYRATTQGGPFVKVNSALITGTTFSDTVQTGQTYYYAATAVNTNQSESVYSNIATAVVP